MKKCGRALMIDCDWLMLIWIKKIDSIEENSEIRSGKEVWKNTYNWLWLINANMN